MEKSTQILVIGGGVAGIQAALDSAEKGFEVNLVEAGPSIGGVMSKLDKTFPTNDCSMCILAPRLVAAARQPNINIITSAQVKEIKGKAGYFKVKIIKKARYVDLDKCTGCGDCTEACPVEVPNKYEENLTNRKVIYRPFAQAIPSAFGIDKKGIPPCRATCPLHVNVQGYVALISKGKFKEALEVIRGENPLPGICGRVCTHPCEDECQRQRVDKPIAISLLKRFAADYEKEVDIDLEVEKEKDRKVAIIGSGPAGLTVAYDLKKRGYKVTIFEALPVAGGMLAVGIPDYRLPKNILRKEIGILEKLGIEIRLNTPIGIGISLKLEDLIKDGYEAVFIAVGAHISMKLQISGEDLRGIYPGVEFLKKVNLGEKVEVGEKVVVVGGGNVAIDAARTAYRLGAKEVTIIYRRSRREMPANEEEIEEAANEGIKMLYLATPTKIIGKEGKVTQIECIRMKLGELDATGRRKPIPIPGSVFIFDTDMVIPAIGQSPNLSLLSPHYKFNLVRGKRFEVDPVTLETNVKGIFAGGDAVTGPNTVIEAMAAGRKAAISIDRYLNSKDMRIGREGEGAQESKIEADIKGLKPEKRKKVATLSGDERKANFKEVVLGFSEEEAVAEAKRCLNCGVCSECMECVKACDAKAIDHTQIDKEIVLEVGAIILAIGTEHFDAKQKSEYGYGRFPNVITSTEMERILSASGPTGAEVIRLSDKEHPKKIAFIQCIGSRDPSCGNEYCSSVCCMYATKEANIIKEHLKEVDITIFFMDMRAYGKDFERYYERAKNELNVRYVRSIPSSIEETGEKHNLLLKYETVEGKSKREEFDLVVLSVGLTPSAEIKDLSRKFDIKLNKDKFCRTSFDAPLKTSREGIFICGTFQGPKDIPESVVQASGAAAELAEILPKQRKKLVEQFVERDVRTESPRIGIFICRCGINIAGVVDVPKVTEYSKSLENVVFVMENMYTCSQDTQEIIKQKIKECNLNRIIVASCSPRTHEPLFQQTLKEAGLNKYLFEMVNIRDQCSWVHTQEPEKATEKAEDLIRMGVAKAIRLEPLEEIALSVINRGLVIGGGLAGMEAALSLAKQGYQVYLIEKEEELGGNLKNMWFDPDGNNIDDFFRDLKNKVYHHPKIEVFTKSNINKIEGYVGNFKTIISKKENGQFSKSELEHGIIIVATGAEEYIPNEYLYHQNKSVLTQSELSERLRKKQIELKKRNTMVMIQCVGSRDDKHPYCSRVCCQKALQNALKVKEIYPEMDIYILYRDIRSYGFNEKYYNEARKKGIVFIRYEENNKPRVEEYTDAEGIKKVRVLIWDILLQSELNIEADFVILSTGIVAPKDNFQLAQMLKVPLNADGFFLEAHVKLRPVDFATEGIFVCGLAHAPKNMEESICQAKAAASRAANILCKDSIIAGGIVAFVNEDICSGCGICEVLCPYEAIEIDEKDKVAKINTALCKGCGTCCAACPSGAVELKGFRKKQILSMIDIFAEV